MERINDLDEQIRNEENTKLKYITPVLQKKWNNEGDDIIMEYGTGSKGNGYYFTNGKVTLDENGNCSRGDKKKIDYLLLIKNGYPLAIVEAKSYDHSLEDGVSQAIEYAQILDVPFAYSSNGKGFHEEDLLTGENRKLKMEEFPTSDELWTRYLSEKKLKQEETNIMITPYYRGQDGRVPRYYQRNAINRTIEHIVKGNNRGLIVMATGTGKTYVAMQIIYKLYESKLKKKILFLVDRNALADQTFDAFTPFKDKMIKIGTKKDGIEYNLKDKDNINKLASYEIFISLYHQMMSGTNDDVENDEENQDNNQADDKAYYKNLPKDFFDLIVVDECYRGSRNEIKGYHDILSYFSSATQIGMTATPKDANDGSNIEYFGKPLYKYTLKQGIEDGFLAPYRVIYNELEVDRDGYMPKSGELDINGKPLEERLYEQNEFDKKLIIEERRKIVAKKISDYLKQNDRFMKTIVFCETEEHAGAMRDLLKNKNKDLVAKSQNYIVRITASDDVGKKQIDNFKSSNEMYPVIACTSKLLSTGIDTKTVGLIVLDKTINSMTEFKQTIGRGTRIEEEYKCGDDVKSKLFFTIIDFRKNYIKFSDKEFDGDIEITNGGISLPCKIKTKKPKKEIFRVNGQPQSVVGTKIIYYNENFEETGTTDNLFQRVKNNILENYKTADELKKKWFSTENKEELLDSIIIDKNYYEAIKDSYPDNIDNLDMILSIGYDIVPMNKESRVRLALNFINGLNVDTQKILKLLMELYLSMDFYELCDVRIFDLPLFEQNNYNRKTAIQTIGSREKFDEIMKEIEKNIYGE